MFQKKGILILLVVFAFSSPLLAQTQAGTPTAFPAASPSPPPPEETSPFDPLHLKGRNGFGIGYSQHGTSLDYRHWDSDSFAWGLLAWVSYDDSQSNYDFSGNYVEYPNWNFALGFEMKTNIARPIEGVFLQLFIVPNFSLYHSESSNYFNFSSGGAGESANNRIVTDRYVASLFLGPGFEAFLPFWKNVSVEGNIGAILSMNWIDTHTSWNPARYSIPDSYQSTSYFGTDFQENGFSILNAYVHVYF